MRPKCGDTLRLYSTACICLNSHALKKKSLSKIKLLLADDHPVVRKGIGSCLSRHAHLEIAGEAADGQEAVLKVRELLPDILLMDINMPKLDGVAVAELLHQEAPRTKVIILSMHLNKDQVLRLIHAGVRGYVLKDASPEELLRAIEAVNAGETFFSPDVARLALNQYVADGGRVEPLPASRLTERERQVVAHIAEGLSNKEVSDKLGIGVRTVETHRERIMRKLDVHNAAGLTRFAIANNLVKLN
jgi:two-component system, NarL family, nitrate/nitrite response regulator NarL